MKHVSQLMMLTAATLLAGCVGNPLKPAGNTQTADQAPARTGDIRADSQPDRESALYGQALGYLSVDNNAYDPWKARQLLETLQKNFPNGAHAVEAEAILNLLNDLNASANHTKALEKELAQKDAAMEQLRSALLSQ